MQRDLINSEDVFSSPYIPRDNTMFELSIRNEETKSFTIASRDDPDSLVSWLSVRRDSWMNDENTYLYHNVPSNEVQRFGPWSEEEKQHFLHSLHNREPKDNEWGLFSKRIPGRTGSQCRRFYYQLFQTHEQKSSPISLSKVKFAEYENHLKDGDNSLTPKVQSYPDIQTMTSSNSLLSRFSAKL